MRTSYRPWVMGALVTMIAIAGCGGDKADQPASTLSKAEHDSVLGASNLPGAATVKGALDVADSSRARADKLDEMSSD